MIQRALDLDRSSTITEKGVDQNLEREILHHFSKENKLKMSGGGSDMTLRKTVDQLRREANIDRCKLSQVAAE